MAVWYEPAVPPLRVLVCGGRDYSNAAQLYRLLDSMNTHEPFECIIHGAARGADSLAGQWAKERGVPVFTYPADWSAHGKAAGAIRNQRMLDEGKPNYVVAFPGGRGTADMMRRAKAAGVDHMQVLPPSPDRNAKR